MAVRRDVLARLGGFDEAYHYYLDETDLNWRLHLGGYQTQLVPLAQVVHGFAPPPIAGPIGASRRWCKLGHRRRFFCAVTTPNTGRARPCKQQHSIKNAGCWRKWWMGGFAPRMWGGCCAAIIWAWPRAWRAPCPTWPRGQTSPHCPFAPFPAAPQAA